MIYQNQNEFIKAVGALRITHPIERGDNTKPQTVAKQALEALSELMANNPRFAFNADNSSCQEVENVRKYFENFLKKSKDPVGKPPPPQNKPLLPSQQSDDSCWNNCLFAFFKSCLQALLPCLFSTPPENASSNAEYTPLSARDKYKPIKGREYNTSDKEPIGLKDDTLSDLLKSKEYNFIRDVRGDGNCYYRAVMFGLIEQCIQNNPPKLQVIADAFLDIINEIPREFRKAHLNLTEKLQEAARKRCWLTVDQFRSSIEDSSKLMDEALIRASRYLIAKEIETLELSKTPRFNESSKEDISKEKKQLKENALTMNAFAADHIDLHLIAKKLNFSISIKSLNHNQQTESITLLDSDLVPSYSSSHSKEEVFLLHNITHYQILYK